MNFTIPAVVILLYYMVMPPYTAEVFLLYSSLMSLSRVEGNLMYFSLAPFKENRPSYVHYRHCEVAHLLYCSLPPLVRLLRLSGLLRPKPRLVVRLSGERLSGERLSCERLSGERLSGERL